MTDEQTSPAVGPEEIEVPAATATPLVLALAVTLMATGLVTNLAMTVLGLVIFVPTFAAWMWQLLPGAGRVTEPLVPPEQRSRPPTVCPDEVEAMRVGMPGHRLRIPEKIHPYSAGVKGGIYGGIAMTVPALVYGMVSGHGPWYPVNLLVGMVLPLPQRPDGSLDIAQLDQFHPGWLILGIVIHAVISVSLGLLYGVLLPTLPSLIVFWGGLGAPLVRGGVVAPLLWTGASYGFMGVLNPQLREVVFVNAQPFLASPWIWFVASQFVYGVVVALVVVRSEMVYSSEVFGGSRTGPRPAGDTQATREEASNP